MKFKINRKIYYFNYQQALAITGFMFLLPALVMWGNGIRIDWLSPWNLIILALTLYLIYQNCIWENKEPK